MQTDNRGSATGRVFIVGIGDDGLAGLTAAARQLVRDAAVVLGSEKSLAELGGMSDQRLELFNDLDRLVTRLASATERPLVVLASGDPLFYGTARFLCERLGKDRFEVVPHVSSMQLAFARVKESWDEAYLTNLASQNLERILDRIRTAEKVGLFTTEQTPPAGVARLLQDRRIDYFTAYVCENLGSPDERVTHADLEQLVDQTFSPLNVMILVRKPGAPDRPPEHIGRRLFGNPDERFLQSQPKRGLLTPAEVRCLALAEMDLGPRSVVWDVGAGSGSVAVEAALIAAEGQVFAIEMDPEDQGLIRANAERFGVNHLTPVLGQAPGVWDSLPDPDAIFVGGTGRHVGRMVELGFQRLRSGGRLVAHVSSVENLAEVHAVLAVRSLQTNVWMLNISRGTYQLDSVRFEAVNPSFLLSAVKQSKHE